MILYVWINCWLVFRDIIPDYTMVFIIATKLMDMDNTCMSLHVQWYTYGQNNSKVCLIHSLCSEFLNDPDQYYNELHDLKVLECHWKSDEYMFVYLLFHFCFKFLIHKWNWDSHNDVLSHYNLHVIITIIDIQVCFIFASMYLRVKHRSKVLYTLCMGE